MARAGTGTSGPEPLSPAAQTFLQSYVAEDAASHRLLEQARRIARAAALVLVRGESGVGKDMMAQLLHYLGPHPAEPLLKIDCASLPHELVESELFGYERGAFTGASQAKPGRLELAGRGTIVLDEIGAMSLGAQAKLLRVVEDRTFHRLGGTRDIRIHARLVALSNRNLEHAVAAGAFRQDLFFRLNVLPLLVPPLRERPADIAPLARRLLASAAAAHGRPQLHYSPAALRVLVAFSFPGNVRELRNLCERLAATALNDEITPEALPAMIRQPSSSSTRPTLEEVERAYIAEILDHCRGRKSDAAQILGISRKTLLEKRKKYGLD